MPNIEIHGLKNETREYVHSKIRSAFAEKPYRDDYVITAYESKVHDWRLNAQPFIRLVTTPSDHTEDIIQELQKLDLDIEVMILDRFIPRK